MGRDIISGEIPDPGHISIHAPRVGRDAEPAARGSPSPDFNPRAPCGARHEQVRLSRSHCNFNPRAPCGARLCSGFVVFRKPEFQSTRPVWGATILFPSCLLAIAISIHAPRVGRDATVEESGLAAYHFNPRAPCGARRSKTALYLSSQYFNPRAPCGARRMFSAAKKPRRAISIHAPRVGRDRGLDLHKPRGVNFNPRAPCGARPVEDDYRIGLISISIHAPRVGRDGHGSSRHCEMSQFQSTRPVWGATILVRVVLPLFRISIHAPRVGRDPNRGRFALLCRYFNPRAPCGARPSAGTPSAPAATHFNPRAPCGARQDSRTSL